MALPDDDKDAVGRMIQWLYTRNFELTIPISAETSGECYLQLAKLNTLADKYDIYLLRNRIVDELFDLAVPPKDIKPPQIPVVAYVYKNTAERSSFRKLMVAWYAYRVDFVWYEKETTKAMLAEVPQDFAIDLAMAIAVRHKYPDRRAPFTQPSSAYHETPPKKGAEDHA